MKEKWEQCCDRLKKEVNITEDHLVQAGHHLGAAIESGVETLEVRGKEARAKCEAKQEEAAEAGERVKRFLEETKNTAVTKLEDWKTDREIGKIENHADKAEQQAVDAILLAAYSVLEAEVAIVEALKARKIAIEVAG